MRGCQTKPGCEPATSSRGHGGPSGTLKNQSHVKFCREILLAPVAPCHVQLLDQGELGKGFGVQGNLFFMFCFCQRSLEQESCLVSHQFNLAQKGAGGGRPEGWRGLAHLWASQLVCDGLPFDNSQGVFMSRCRRGSF